MSILKSEELAGENYNKSLLIFYESDCGPCENLLQQLLGNYEYITSKGIRILAFSSDRDERIFKEKEKSFPWKDTFCDYEGKKGANFKNYGVSGTPTLFLINKEGKIEARMSSLQALLESIK